MQEKKKNKNKNKHRRTGCLKWRNDEVTRQYLRELAPCERALQTTYEDVPQRRGDAKAIYGHLDCARVDLRNSESVAEGTGRLCGM